MAKYISGKVKDLNIGISNYSENKTSATVIGNVGIGTNVPTDPVGSGNTAVLAAGIVSAYQFYGDGSNITGVGATDKIVTDSLDVLGISTLRGTLSVGGVSTFTGNSTFSGDAAFHGGVTLGNATSDEVNGVARFAMDLIPSSTGDKDLGSNDPTRRWGNLHVKNIFQAGDGISTFTNDIDANADVNIAGVATVSSLVGISGSLTNINITGIGTFSDNVKLNFGGSNDLQIYHATSGGGSTSYVDNNTGPLYIRNNVDDDDGGNIIIEAKSGKASAVFQDDEGVRLYFNDAEKFATLSTGATVTGDLYATTFYGDGSNLAGVVTNTGINTTGTSDFSTLNVSTLLDVDGHTELDDVNVSGVATFAGNVSIAGTLTYEDVTNIDSIGIVTAQGGIRLAGVVTAISGCSAVQYYGDGSGLTNVGASSTDAWIADSQENLVAGNGAGAARDAATCFNILVGCNAGNSVNAGDYNVFMGFGAGKDATGSACNVAIGYSAGSGLTQGNNQVFIGNRAGEHASNINGKNGVAIGNHAGNNKVCHDVYIGCGAGELNDGKYNVFLGSGVGAGITDGNCNIMMGHLAGKEVTTGDTNVFLGRRAGQCATESENNVFIGGYAGYNNQNAASGDTNVAVGYAAGMCLGATARCNTIIGPYAGSELDAGCSNVILGQGSGYNTAGGNYNNFFGHYAGQNHSTGDCNIAIGRYAGKSVGGGTNNIFFGGNAGCSSYGQDNIIIGSGAASGLTGGNWNTVIGKNAASSMTLIGGQNVFLGMEAGCTQTTTCYSVVIGQGARLPITDGYRQLSIGCYSKSWIVGDCDFNVGIGTTIPTAAVGSGNTAVLAVGIVSAYQLYGDGSGITNVSAGGTTTWQQDAEGNLVAGTGAGAARDADTCFNTLIGTTAGAALNSGDYNVFIGCAAGCLATSGEDNIALGRGAMSGQSLTGAGNVAIGLAAGKKLTDGEYNIHIGVAAGRCSISGDYNVTLGYYAGGGTGNFTGDDNILIGDSTGCKITTGSDNIALGKDAMSTDSVTGSYNVLFGHKAGQDINSAGCNTIIGLKAGCKFTAASNNTVIGCLAGANLDGATVAYNILIGDKAGQGTAGCSGISNNLFIGWYAGTNIQTASYNVSVGRQSGKCLTTQSRNAFFGHYAGCAVQAGCNTFLGHRAGSGGTVITGGKNIAIGLCANVPDTTGSNQLAIGICTDNWIVGNGNFNVGIGTTNPELAVGAGNTAKLSVGIVSSYQLYGHLMTDAEGSLYIGKDAGASSGVGACYNIAIGYEAGKVTGDENIFIGKGAGKSGTTSGSGNIFIGCYTGLCMGGGGGNQFIGDNAGRKSTGAYNVVLGRNAFCGDASHNGWNNVVIGVSAAKNVTGGNANVFIGQYAACDFTTGCRNVVIGYQVHPPSLSGDNQLAIGCGSHNWIVGDSSFNVGIGTTIPTNAVGAGNTAKLSVGIVSAYQLYGDGSGLTNVGGASTDAWAADSQENLFAGTSAGASRDADTCFNIGIGYSAGNALNAGDENIFLGSYAGQSQTTATNNIFIGRRSGQSFVSGGSQVFIGNDAGRKMCDGYQNVAIGYAALRGSNTVADNDGEKNIALGTSAGEELTGGDHNVLLGSGAGKGLTTGIYNIFIGGYGGQAAVVGRHNIAMGRKAGRDLTCGDGNIFLGEYAGASSTLGDGNIFMGCYAGTNMVGDPANRNVLIGDYAGCSLSTGCYNVAIGCGALQGTSTPADNTGHNNIAIGCKTAYGIKSGAYNILFGKSAGCAVSDGNLNIFIGKYAGCTTTTGSCNIAIGCMVHLPSVTDDNQLAIGKGTNYWITGNADFNVGIGTTNPNAAVGAGNTAKLSVGILSAYQLYGDGSSLTGVGFSPDAQENLYAGTDAGAASDADTCYNIALGWSALKTNCAGDNNIALGLCAGYSITSGTCNILIGRQSGSELTDQHNHIMIGACAGRCVCTGSSATNVFIGYAAAQCVCGAHNNVFIGKYAGREDDLGFNKINNVFIGSYSGQCTVNASGNVFIGYQSGRCSSCGTCNTFLGDQSGISNTIGDFNVAIGYKVCTPIATGCSQLAIGCNQSHWIIGDSSYNVGIGTTIPTNAVGAGNTAKLSVGILSAYQLYGDGSGLTGVGGDTFWVSNSTGIHTTSNIGIGTTNASDATVNIDVGTATTALVVQGSAGQLFSVTNSLSSGSIFSVNDISGIPSIDVDADGTIQLAPYGTGEMVGVGTTSPTSKLHVIGGALITGVVTATDVDSTSDIRLKTNIQPIEDPLAKVIQIEGVSFNWKQDNRPALGVIADQVEKILPQLVHGDDPKTVNYNGLIGLLIEAVKEQQSEIDTLKERISKLE